MLRREREEMGKMRQFRVDHNVGETVGRFGAPDTAPKRRRDPTAPYPVARHPLIFPNDGLFRAGCFFRALTSRRRSRTSPRRPRSTRVRRG
jgi:hypothetical protein